LFFARVVEEIGVVGEKEGFVLKEQELASVA
jgi:hypothetical protein